MWVVKLYVLYIVLTKVGVKWKLLFVDIHNKSFKFQKKISTYYNIIIISPKSAIEFKSKIQMIFPQSIYTQNLCYFSNKEHKKKFLNSIEIKKRTKKKYISISNNGNQSCQSKIYVSQKKVTFFSYNQKLQWRRYMQTCDLKKKKQFRLVRLQSKKKKIQIKLRRHCFSSLYYFL